jgi:hypothetical protein
MPDRFRSRLTYANVMATIAVFLGLGGGAWATHEMIDSSDVVDGSLRGDDIQNQTLTGADFALESLGTSRIRDDNVQSIDLKDGTVAAPDLAGGAVTPEKFGTIPAARAIKTTTQSVPDVMNTTLSFDSESFDTAGLHDNSVNNSRLTAPIAGVYQVSAGAAWDMRPPPGTNRMLGLAVNGACCSATSLLLSSSGAETLQNVSDLVKLSAGGFVEAVARQPSGSPILIKPGPFVGGNAEVFLAMTWVGPG